MELTKVVAATVASAAETLFSNSNARNSFQWGGTIFALLLLILNRIGQRSPMQTTLLVLYLFTSFPNVLFEILRGQFGYWIAFLAVVANLFFPQTFPFSRFLLFVVTPDWVASGLRDSVVGCIFCFIILVSLIITKIQGIGGIVNCECTCHCLSYCLCIAFLIYFTILYMLGALVDEKNSSWKEQSFGMII